MFVIRVKNILKNVNVFKEKSMQEYGIRGYMSERRGKWPYLLKNITFVTQNWKIA